MDIFPKNPRRHFKILGARQMKWSTFHTEDPQTSATTEQSLVTRATWHPGFCIPAFNYFRGFMFSFHALWNESQTLSVPTNALFYILCILLFICSCMFQRNHHLQGAYTNAVKTYSNKTVLWWSYISIVHVLVKIDST